MEPDPMPTVGPPPGLRRSPWNRPALLIVAGFVLIAPLGLGLFYWVETARLRHWATQTGQVPPLIIHRFAEFFEGIDTPPTVPANQATLADDEPVIGVELDGKARAYRLRAMRDMTTHIVNDVVNGTAVTVTYCDLTDCIRGFGGEARPTPLNIDQGGLLDGEMVLRIGRSGYLQKSQALIETDIGHRPAPFPYAEVPLTRTTWAAWKAQHPETDVYEGITPPGR